MREMNNDELALFDILKDNDKAKNNNYEALRLFYKQQYDISLPDLKGVPNLFTIERYIRKLKQLYPSQLTSPKEREIKLEKEIEFKEMVRDDNAPLLPDDEGQIRLWW